MNAAEIGPFPPPEVQPTLVRSMLGKKSRRGIGLRKKLLSSSLSSPSVPDESKNENSEKEGRPSKAGKILSAHIRRQKSVIRIWAHVSATRLYQFIDKKYTAEFSGGSGHLGSARSLYKFVARQTAQLQSTIKMLCEEPARSAENEVHDLYLDELDARPPWDKTEPSVAPYRKLLQMANQMRWDALRDLGCDALNSLLSLLEKPSEFPCFEVKDEMMYGKRTKPPLLKNRSIPFELVEATKTFVTQHKKVSSIKLTKWQKKDFPEKMIDAIKDKIRKEMMLGYQLADKAAPMFEIKVIQHRGWATYDPPLLKFEEQMIQLVRNVVIELRNTAETRPLMIASFEERGKRLSPCVPPLEDSPVEPFLKEVEDRVVKAMRRHFSILGGMAARVNEYKYLLKIDTSQYLKEFKASADACEDEYQIWYDEISKQYNLAREIDGIMPRKICLGLFDVDCTHVRELMDKHSRGLALELLKLLTDSILDDCNRAKRKYKPLVDRLEKNPESYDELESLLRLIKNIEPRLQAASGAAGHIWSMMSIFSKFSFSVSDEARSTFIDAAAWPSRIMKALQECESRMPQLRWKFITKLGAESKEFEATLTKCEADMKLLAVLGVEDLAHAAEYSQSADKLMSVLVELHEKVETINRQRRILDLDTIESKKLVSLTELSSSLRKAWGTASGWREARTVWMDGDVTALDKTEQECVTYTRNLNEATIVAKEGIPGVTDGASTIAMIDLVRSELREFWNFMPIIRAMQTPGLQKVHKEEIAEELGIALNISEGDILSLRKMSDAGVMQVVGKVVDICTLAGVQYAIEDALLIQQADWVIGHRYAGPTKDTETNIRENKTSKDEEKGQMESRKQILTLETILYATIKKNAPNGCRIVASTTDIFEAIHEQLVECEKIKDLPFAKGFEGRISNWQKQLRSYDESLHIIVCCQEMWKRMASFFWFNPNSTSPITFSLKTKEIFAKADAAWTAVVDMIASESRVMELFKHSAFRPKAMLASKTMQVAWTAVVNECKVYRKSNPRLHLLNDEDLVAFMAIDIEERKKDSEDYEYFENENTVQSIVAEMPRFVAMMFPNIKGINFDEKTLTVTSIITRSGSIFHLSPEKIVKTVEPLPVSEKVLSESESDDYDSEDEEDRRKRNMQLKQRRKERPDIWLSRLENAIFGTLKDMALHAWNTSQNDENQGFILTKSEAKKKEITTDEIIEPPRLDKHLKWTSNYATQISLLSSSLVFTKLCEATLNNRTECALLQAKIDDLRAKASLPGGGFGGKSKSKLRKEARQGEKDLEKLKEKRLLWNSVIESTIAISNAYAFALKESIVKSTIKRDLIHLELMALQALRHRDIVASFPKTDDLVATSFEWQSTLRFYYKTDDKGKSILSSKKNDEEVEFDIEAELLTARLSYSFELLSPLNQRLVVTPLTNRCRRALLVSLSRNQGGLLVGPAVSGKSSVVRDLAFELGRGLLEYSAIMEGSTEKNQNGQLGRLLPLVQAASGIGLWLLARRIEKMSASVFTELIDTVTKISAAVEDGKEDVDINDNLFCLHKKKRCALFLTVRSPLPLSESKRIFHGTSKMFRRIGLICPETSVIAKMLLEVHGFHDAEQLAVKMTVALQSLRKCHVKNLSGIVQGSEHCIGLILRVIKMAGAEKRVIELEASLSLHGKKKGQQLLHDTVRVNKKESSGDDEEIALIHTNVGGSIEERLIAEKKLIIDAIVVCVTPHLRGSGDIFLFHDVMESIFGVGCTSSMPEWQNIANLGIQMQDLHSAAAKMGYELSLHSAQKVCQLITALKTKRSVMLCGVPCSGKTVALNIAAAVWKNVNFEREKHQSVLKEDIVSPQIIRVFPEVHSMNELFGWFEKKKNNDKRRSQLEGEIQWCNGLIPSILSTFSISIENQFFKQEQLQRDLRLPRGKFGVKAVETCKTDPIEIEWEEDEKVNFQNQKSTVLNEEKENDESITAIDARIVWASQTVGRAGVDSLDSINEEEEKDLDSTNVVAVKEESSREETPRWLVFDGPASKRWAEEIGPFAENNMIVFEVASLQDISPSTITQCSLVSLGSEQLQSYMLIDVFAWRLHGQLSVYARSVREMITFALESGLKWLRMEHICDDLPDIFITAEYLRTYMVLLGDFCETLLQDVTETNPVRLKDLASRVLEGGGKKKESGYATYVGGVGSGQSKHLRESEKSKMKRKESDMGKKSSPAFGEQADDVNYPSASKLLKMTVAPSLKINPIKGSEQLASLSLVALFWTAGCKVRTTNEEKKFKEFLLSEMEAFVRVEGVWGEGSDEINNNTSKKEGTNIRPTSSRAAREKAKERPLWNVIRTILTKLPGSDMRKGISEVQRNEERSSSMLDWVYNVKRNTWSVRTISSEKRRYRKSGEINEIGSQLPMMLAMPKIREYSMASFVGQFLEAKVPIALSGHSKQKQCFMKRLLAGTNIYTMLNVSKNAGAVPIVCQSIKSRMVKRKAGILSPPANKKLVVFVEDIWAGESKTSIQELLRQVLERGGFFEEEIRGKFNWCQIRGLLFVGSVNQKISNIDEQRIRRHFNVINIPDLTDEDVRTIFCSTFTSLFSDKQRLIPAAVSQLSSAIASATADFYFWLKENLVQSMEHPQYAIFQDIQSLNEIAKILLSRRSRVSCREVVRHWWDTCLVWAEHRILNEYDKRCVRSAISELSAAAFDLPFPAVYNFSLQVGWELVQEKVVAEPVWQHFSKELDTFVDYDEKSLQETLEKTWNSKKKQVKARYHHRLLHFDLRKRPMQQILPSTGKMTEIRRHIPDIKPKLTMEQVRMHKSLEVIFQGLHKSFNYKKRYSLLKWKANIFIDKDNYPETDNLFFLNKNTHGILEDQGKNGVDALLSDSGENLLGEKGRYFHQTKVHVSRAMNGLRRVGGSNGTGGTAGSEATSGIYIARGPKSCGKKTCIRLAVSNLQWNLFEIDASKCTKAEWNNFLTDALLEIVESKTPVVLFVIHAEYLGKERVKELNLFECGELPRLLHGDSDLLPMALKVLQRKEEQLLVDEAVAEKRKKDNERKKYDDGEKDQNALYELLLLFRNNIRIAMSVDDSEDNLSLFYERAIAVDQYQSFAVEEIKKLLVDRFPQDIRKVSVSNGEDEVDLIHLWPLLQECVRGDGEFSGRRLLNTIGVFEELHRRIYPDFEETFQLYHNALNKAMEMREKTDTIKENLKQVMPRITLLQSDENDRKKRYEEIQAEIKKLKAKQRKMEKAVDDISGEIVGLENRYAKETTSVEKAYDNSLKHLKQLKQKDFDDTRKVKSPSEESKLVAAALCIMLGIDAIDEGSDSESEEDEEKEGKKSEMDLYWIQANKIYSDFKSLRMAMVTYDRKKIEPPIFSKIDSQKYLRHPLFIPKGMSKIGKVEEALCRWVRAVCATKISERKIKPVKKEIKILGVRLKRGKSKLNVYLEQLQDHAEHAKQVQTQIKKIRIDIKNLHLEAKRQEQELAEYEKALECSQPAIQSWRQRVKEEDQRMKQMFGNLVIASFATVYLGSFQKKRRDQIVQDWRILLSEWRIESYDGESFLQSQSELLQKHERVVPLLTNDVFFSLQDSQLPVNCYTNESVFIWLQLSRTNLWPILIDLDGEAEKWLSQFLNKGQRLNCTTSEDPELEIIIREMRKENILLIDITSDDKFDSLAALLLETSQKNIFLITRQDNFTVKDSDSQFVPVRYRQLLSDETEESIKNDLFQFAQIGMTLDYENKVESMKGWIDLFKIVERRKAEEAKAFLNLSLIELTNEMLTIHDEVLDTEKNLKSFDTSSFRETSSFYDTLINCGVDIARDEIFWSSLFDKLTTAMENTPPDGTLVQRVRKAKNILNETVKEWKDQPCRVPLFVESVKRSNEVIRCIKKKAKREKRDFLRLSINSINIIERVTTAAIGGVWIAVENISEEHFGKLYAITAHIRRLEQIHGLFRMWFVASKAVDMPLHLLSSIHIVQESVISEKEAVIIDAYDIAGQPLVESFHLESMPKKIGKDSSDPIADNWRSLLLNIARTHLIVQDCDFVSIYDILHVWNSLSEMSRKGPSASKRSAIPKAFISSIIDDIYIQKFPKKEDQENLREELRFLFSQLIPRSQEYFERLAAAKKVGKKCLSDRYEEEFQGIANYEKEKIISSPRNRVVAAGGGANAVRSLNEEDTPWFLIEEDSHLHLKNELEKKVESREISEKYFESSKDILRVRVSEYTLGRSAKSINL
eukprot:g3008.t1